MYEFTCLTYTTPVLPLSPCILKSPPESSLLCHICVPSTITPTPLCSPSGTSGHTVAHSAELGWLSARERLWGRPLPLLLQHFLYPKPLLSRFVWCWTSLKCCRGDMVKCKGCVSPVGSPRTSQCREKAIVGDESCSGVLWGLNHGSQPCFTL